MLFMQRAPERIHFPADVLGNGIRVRLFAVEDALDQHTVIDAVVLDAGTREDVVDIIGFVIVQRRFQIDRLTGIHAFSELCIVKEQLVFPQVVLVRCRQLIVKFAAILPTGFIKLQQLLFSRFCPLSLFRRVFAAGYLNKYFLRCTAADMRDFLGDLQRLPDAAANRRRNIHFIQLRAQTVASKAAAAPLFRCSRQISILGIIEQLHEIEIRIPQKTYDVLRLSLLIGGRIQLRKELLGKAAPIRVFQTAYASHFILCEHGIVFLQPSPQHTLVVAINKRCFYDLLDCLFAELGKQRRKIMV